MNSLLRGRLTAVVSLCASGLLVLTGCTSAPAEPPEAAAPATPTPSAAWGDWADVDGAVMSVGSTTDRVIVSGLDEPAVIVLDRSTGDEVWRIGSDPDGDSSGAEGASAENWTDDDWTEGAAWEHGLVLHDDDTIYTQRGSGDGSLVAYSAEDGSEFWRVSPGTLDACAPADAWALSPSVSQSYEAAESGQLILSHTQPADWDCHDGPNATRPGTLAMLVVDATTGEVTGDPVRIAGTAIPGMSMPDPSGRYIDVPFELQASVNVIRVDASTGEEQWAMLLYPDPSDFDPELGDSLGPATVTAAGEDRFLIQSHTDGGLLATVEAWADDHMETGDVSVEDLNYELPCEYRMQRSSAGDSYCLLLTSSPNPDHDAQFLVSVADPSTGAATGEPLAVPAPASLIDTDEYYGYVDAPTVVENDALIPASARGTDSPAIVLPTDAGLQAVDVAGGDAVWTWDSGDDTAVAGHVVPDVLEVVVGVDDRAVGIDALTGNELWDEPAHGPVFGVDDVITITDFMTGTTRVRTTHPVG